MNDEFNKVIIDDILESFGEHGNILVALGVHNLTNDNFTEFFDLITDIYYRGMLNGAKRGISSMTSLAEPGGLADPGERGKNWDRTLIISGALKGWFGTPDAWLARKFGRKVKPFNRKLTDLRDRAREKLNELRDLERNKPKSG